MPKLSFQSVLLAGLTFSSLWACSNGQTGDAGLDNEAVGTSRPQAADAAAPPMTADDLASADAASDDTTANDTVETTTTGDSVTQDAGASEIQPTVLTTCNPLAAWERELEASTILLAGSAPDGVVYGVLPLDAGWVALRSSGESLVPLQVTGSGSTANGTTLTVAAPDGDFVLEFDTEAAEPQLLLRASPELRIPPLPLQPLDQAALAAYTLQPLTAAARVEVHAQDELEQLEVLLLSPEWGGDYADFRLFIGNSDGAMTEVSFQNFMRARDGGSSSLTFQLPNGDTAQLNFENAETGAGLFVGETGEHLWRRSSTRLGLARLSFECLEPTSSKFELSNDPPSPALPMACPQLNPMGVCYAGAGVQRNDSESAVGVAATGTLADSGNGLPPAAARESCFGNNPDAALFGEMYDADQQPESLSWFQLQTAAGDGWLVLRGLDNPVLAALGDELQLSGELTWDFGGPTISQLEVQDGADQLLLWLGQGYTLEDLVLPAGLTLAPGAEHCAKSDSCALDYGYFSLEVALGDSNVVDVPSGENISLGDFDFVNNVYQRSTGDFACTDASSAFVRSALLRKQP